MLFLRASLHIEVLYPEQGGVEMDPNTLWKQVLQVVKVSSPVLVSLVYAGFGLSNG